MDLTRHTTTSADGTPIGYLSMGSGPPLVVLHGAMQSASSQIDLARLLADEHTVHLVDRRGRGESGAYPVEVATMPARTRRPERLIATELEVEDLTAVLRATGSQAVFGVSSGAIIAARTALAWGAGVVSQVALFEPPLIVDGSLDLGFTERFAREGVAGDLPAQMTTAMVGAQMGPPLMGALPGPLLRAMTRRMLVADDRKALGVGAVHVREMAKALSADFAVVQENAERVADFAAIDPGVDLLLMAGTKTRPYLRTGAAALAAALPAARFASLAGTNHGATSNRADWGKPDVVAPVLARFFDRAAAR